MIGGEGSALRAIEQGIGEREGWLQIAQALRRDHDGTAGDLTGGQLRAYVVEDTEPAGDLLGVAEHAARVLRDIAEDASAEVAGHLGRYTAPSLADLRLTHWQSLGLVSRAISIAAFTILCAGDEARTKRYESAMAWLRDVARGVVLLPPPAALAAPADGSGADRGGTAAGRVESSSSPSVFGDDGLDGGEPPEGCAKWTLRLLADRLVECEIVEAVSAETVRGTLKKTISSRG